MINIYSILAFLILIVNFSTNFENSNSNIDNNISEKSIKPKTESPKDSVYNFNDTIFIKKANTEINKVKHDIASFFINVAAKLKKDTASDISEVHYGLKIKILKDGKPVKSVANTYRFKNEKGNSETEIGMAWLHSRKFQIPYYALDLPAGSHKLTLVFVGYVQNPIQNKIYSVPIQGIKEVEITIQKPEVKKFKINIKELQISNFDSKGKYWDWPQGAPDLEYKIESNLKFGYDTRHSSGVKTNIYSWKNYTISDEIIISENDIITLGVYDSDAFKDDLAGSKSFTLEQLIEISEAKQSISFGTVDKCLIEAVVVK